MCVSGESAEQRKAAEAEVQRSAALGEMQTRGEARPNREQDEGRLEQEKVGPGPVSPPQSCP